MALDKVKDDMLQDNLVFPGSTAQFPSITTDQRNALSGVQPGTIIYNSTVGKLQQYDGSNQWASIDSPPVITSVTYPTENGITATALEASGTTNVSETLIINGSNFSSASEISVQIQISGSYVAFASSVAVNNARTQITCTGVTKRAAADDYVVKVTNVTGLSATTTVNFSADPSFSTAANLGTVYIGQTLSKSIAFTGTKVTQGATAKPTWMTVTGNTSTADNGSGDTTFDATGSPATLGGTIANSGTTQTHTFSIVVRDAENQTFNRDFSLVATDAPTGGETGGADNYNSTRFAGYSTYSDGTNIYQIHKFISSGSFVIYGPLTVDIMVLGGGGGGAAGSSGTANNHGGAGGSGGIAWRTGKALSAGTYTVTVGAGGAGSGVDGTSQASAIQGAKGGNSVFTGGGYTLTGLGGGAGQGLANADVGANADGGSGAGTGRDGGASGGNNRGESTQATQTSSEDSNATAYGNHGGFAGGTTCSSGGGGGGTGEVGYQGGYDCQSAKATNGNTGGNTAPTGNDVSNGGNGTTTLTGMNATNTSKFWWAARVGTNGTRPQTDVEATHRMGGTLVSTLSSDPGTIYLGGGGGGAYEGAILERTGWGGLGGGGRGGGRYPTGNNGGIDGLSGYANTGGGGGSGHFYNITGTPNEAGSGGSGLVLIRYIIG